MLLVTGHAMGWPAFAAAHDGGLYAGMVAAWVVGVLPALFWTFMLIMSEEGMLSGGAAAVATGVCCFLVIIPLFVVLPSYLAANLGLGAATTGDLVFCLACLALAVVLGFMLNCVAFRTLPRPALHGRIGAASVATWVVPGRRRAARGPAGRTPAPLRPTPSPPSRRASGPSSTARRRRSSRSSSAPGSSRRAPR